MPLTIGIRSQLPRTLAHGPCAPRHRVQHILPTTFPFPNEVRMLEGITERVEPAHVMDCVRTRIRQHYPGRVSDIYPGDKRNVNMPLTFRF